MDICICENIIGVGRVWKWNWLGKKTNKNKQKTNPFRIWVLGSYSVEHPCDTRSKIAMVTWRRIISWRRVRTAATFVRRSSCAVPAPGLLPLSLCCCWMYNLCSSPAYPLSGKGSCENSEIWAQNELCFVKLFGCLVFPMPSPTVNDSCVNVWKCLCRAMLPLAGAGRSPQACPRTTQDHGSSLQVSWTVSPRSSRCFEGGNVPVKPMRLWEQPNFCPLTSRSPPSFPRGLFQ